MFSKITSFLARITGFSTPVVGLQWEAPSKAPHIPSFDGIIAITGEENDEILDFLDRNEGNIVHLNCMLDASLATSRQQEIVEREQIDLDATTRGEISHKQFVLLNSSNKSRYLEIRLLPNRRINASSGGTGMILLPLRGFFEISTTVHGGPTIVFYLIEQNASVELRLQVKPNIAKGSE